MFSKIKIKNFLSGLSSKEKGKEAEKIASNYLISQGFKILERNFRAPCGEIDIIAQKGGLLIFVEVKSAFSNPDFLPEEKVDFKKREKIIKSAQYFLLKKSKNLSKIKEIRFDVIVVNIKGELIHYESAFYQEGDFRKI